MATTVEREWLSYREAQEFAGVGRTKLWSLISQGLIPVAKIGRSVRISKGGLEAYMRVRDAIESHMDPWELEQLRLAERSERETLRDMFNGS